MMHRLLFFALTLLAGCQVDMPWRSATELQAYPAGFVAAAQARKQLGDGATFFLRGGYNFTDRQDFGERDNEEGEGPGVGIGYRQDITPMRSSSWFWGVRADVWWLEIDWRDSALGRGTTDVTVFQPAAELGYRVWQQDGGAMEYAASLGAEINVETDGEEVGEGAILLVGVTWVF